LTTLTHGVTNRPPPLVDRNLFTDNRPLVEALEREGGGAHVQRVAAIGATWGAEPMGWGVQANEHPSTLRTHDRYGHRIDAGRLRRALHSTTAAALAADGEYALHGHNWFCSAPMCDLFLVLAQTEGHPSCFAVPCVLPDGERNVFRLQRLKDRLGNRSNASSEVEFDGTWGRLVGEAGRGVATIIEMVAHTCLDCVIGSATDMRAAVAHATWHAAHARPSPGG